jgi:transcriptional regulator with GAF, ATPase, and Fis domain
MPQTTVPIERTGGLLRYDPRSGTLSSREYSVEVVSGPDAGKRAALSGTLRVGSHPEAELCLVDPTVSRFHVELEPRADGVRVRDLESRNGTFMSGVRITEAILEGDLGVVDIGKTSLRISAHEQNLGRPAGAASLGKALGASPAMRQMFGVLERVAPTDSTVVLLGETGTGKEVLAEAIHQASKRKDKKLVVFDCGAVTPSLVESELFGHVKGSFTGAVADRLGAFAEADGGSLFLDEIGELPLDLQPKLLRALESGTVKRLGEDRPRRVDVRIIAATHRDLEAEVEQKRFRGDLYFRLAVVQVRVPPLRERIEDLPLLAHHFVRAMGRGDYQLSPALLERLAAYHWPGNVRELRNVIERALAGGDVEALPDSKLRGARGPAQAITDLPFKEAKEKLVESFTKDYLSALLKQCEGNISQAARTAGINRNYVQRLCVKYGLKATDEP